MKHLLWLLLFSASVAAHAQQVGGEIRISPIRYNTIEWHQGTFYAGSFLTPKTLLRIELGFGFFSEFDEYTSGGQVYRYNYTTSSVTFGLGLDQTMITFPRERITLNLGILATLPRQVHTRIDLTKYRLFDSSIGLRVGYGAGYARHFSEYYSANRWQQIGYFNLGVFYQII